MGLSSFQKLFALALFLFALIQSPLLHSEESPKMSMDSLKYIKSRNIFDPNRVPGVGTTSKKKSKSATVTGQIFLSGTVLLEEKSVAFLTGSTSKKTEIIPLQGTYNGLQVTRIAANEIEVLFEGKTETIPVGAPLLMLAPESAAQTPAIDPTPSPASPPVKVEESGEQSSKKEWYKKRKHGSNNE